MCYCSEYFSYDFKANFLTAQAVPKQYTTQIGGKVTIGKHVIIGTTVKEKKI